MNMTPRNIGLLVGAIIIGLIVGVNYPLLGLLLFIPVIVFVVIILKRNSGSAEASEGAASRAREFTAEEGKAAIYVMRKGFVGGQQGLNITIEGGPTSQFRSGRFVKANVAPGTHTVTALLASQTKGTATSQTVTVAAGEAVLLDAKLNMGALQGSIEFFEIRDAGEARGKLEGLRLVEWSAAE